MDDEGFGVERKTVKNLISFSKLPTWHGKWAEPILELQLLVYTFLQCKQFKVNDIMYDISLSENYYKYMAMANLLRLVEVALRKAYYATMSIVLSKSTWGQLNNWYLFILYRFHFLSISLEYLKS